MKEEKIEMNKDHHFKLKKSGNYIALTADDIIDRLGIGILDFTADDVLEKFMVGLMTLNIIRMKLTEKGLKLHGD
jgi:hypothetical protein